MRFKSALMLVFCGACGSPTFTPAVERRAIPAPFVAADDIEFADAMTWHHAGAIELADEVVARGSSSEVLAVARDVIERHEDELDAIGAARAALTTAAITPLADDPQQDAAITRIGSLAGPALDVAFIEELIPHQADALALAHRALPQLTSPELRALATSLVDTDAREIGDLRALLDTLAPAQD